MRSVAAQHRPLADVADVSLVTAGNSMVVPNNMARQMLPHRHCCQAIWTHNRGGRDCLNALATSTSHLEALRRLRSGMLLRQRIDMLDILAEMG